MGRSMAAHLLAAGHRLTVTTRTQITAEPLLGQGAVWADTAEQVAAHSDVVIAMAGFPSETAAIFQGEHGLFAGAKPGTVLVDMATTGPELAVELGRAALARGIGFVDAPVSGGDIGARNAALSIMVGGSDADVARVYPLFERMGKTVVHQGPVGAGQHTKLVNQILIATNMIGVCEALLYAQRAGLDAERVLASVGGGAAGSWSLANLAPRVLKNDFAPGFYVDHFVKDLGLALSEAKRLKLALPGLALAEQLYIAVQAQGMGKRGTQALYLALAGLSPRDGR